MSSTFDPADGDRARELDRLVLHSWSKHGSTNPFTVARGEGVRLWDHDGREYLDFSSQLVNANIGHSHHQHRLICTAILNGRPDRARKVMEDHCDDTAALLRGLLV